MHPILFRIPLPSTPLYLWWALAAAAVLLFVFAALGFRRGERGGALVFFFLAVGAAVAAGRFKDVSWTAERLPLYSYGVMLGLSLVVGWYLTLRLADKDGLPQETMANCYIVTALSAIVGARLLYVLTNLDQFDSFGDLFSLNRGGLVAYGGFLGGFVGSWAYLRMNGVRLMPWADVAVPSLASGLFITRIGCYLFGCDFGKRLSPDAPAFLQKMGTFPHWEPGISASGDGAEAFVHQLKIAGRGTPAYTELMNSGHSFPVHPTQIYESVAGLALLGLLLWQRKYQTFRGQVFFVFAFAYGYVRFLIEMLRDDPGRNAYGSFSEHLFVPFALFAFALAFALGLSRGIRNAQIRLAAIVVAFVPPVVAYLALRPPTFGTTVLMHPSTSQWIGLVTAVLVAPFYALFLEAARRSPEVAMGPSSLGDFVRDEDEEEAPRPKKKKKKDAPAVETEKATAEATSEDDGDARASSSGETTDDEAPEASADVEKKRDAEAPAPSAGELAAAEKATDPEPTENAS